MLVLERKVGQRVIVGTGVEVTVIQIRGRRVRIGVTAPRETPVSRGEVRAGIQECQPHHWNSLDPSHGPESAAPGR